MLRLAKEERMVARFEPRTLSLESTRLTTMPPQRLKNSLTLRSRPSVIQNEIEATGANEVCCAFGGNSEKADDGFDGCPNFRESVFPGNRSELFEAPKKYVFILNFVFLRSRIFVGKKFLNKPRQLIFESKK